MEFKDYYSTLGVARDASSDDIRGAYRKLARKFHPDVSKEQNAEARFKEIGEAHEVLRDPEKRAAYDDAAAQWRRQQAGGGSARGGTRDFQPPPGWNAGHGFGRSHADVDDFAGMDHSDFFEALFGRAGDPRRAGARAGQQAMRGRDHHAKVDITLEDSYRGAQRSLSVRMPTLDDQGRTLWRDRTLDVNIPKGIREGQQLRLAGQGAPGRGGGAPGDLLLEVAFRPHPRFRVDQRDVYLDLPLAPWEAALGAEIRAATPIGDVELTVPPDSVAGRKLRLTGRGIPGTPPGDLYAVLSIALPPADDAASRAAYEAFRAAFEFDPRVPRPGQTP